MTTVLKLDLSKNRTIRMENKPGVGFLEPIIILFCFFSFAPTAGHRIRDLVK